MFSKGYAKFERGMGVCRNLKQCVVLHSVILCYMYKSVFVCVCVHVCVFVCVCVCVCVCKCITFNGSIDPMGTRCMYILWNTNCGALHVPMDSVYYVQRTSPIRTPHPWRVLAIILWTLRVHKPSLCVCVSICVCKCTCTVQ